MEKILLPDRDVLKKIVVQVGESIGKGETRRVIDNTQLNVNIVRRSGEGSRPLFDRIETINGRRIFYDVKQDRRFSYRSHRAHLDRGDRLRTKHDNYRRDYHSDTRERSACERSRDDLFFRSRGACPYHSLLDGVTDCGESCREGWRRRIFRTLSNEGLAQTYPGETQNVISNETGISYLCHKPYCYAGWESTPSHSTYDFVYYPY